MPPLSGIHTVIAYLIDSVADELCYLALCELTGWGDQGIFFGMATCDPETGYMPKDHTIAKRLCKALYESGLGGLDVKTQIVMDDDTVTKVIAAVPLLSDDDREPVERLIRSQVSGHYQLILNGTGGYVRHSSIADCGTTGRKLAVDFYGGNCKIGGGSPWTKDASKADLTLNLFARQLARGYAQTIKGDAFVSLACCIGSQEVDARVCDASGKTIDETVITVDPLELREKYALNTPIYASMCRWGLFGEYQHDKVWETDL